MKLIIDLQYFPSIISFEISYKFSNIIFDQYEYYQKMSFRNRCRIVGADGPIDLSVPLLKGRDQKTVMKDVRISGLQPWQDRHWKTIVSCYNRSPWFEFYRDGLEGLYRKPFVFLFDWNLACFDWMAGVLKMAVPVSLSEGYRKEYDKTEWVDWRGKILPKNNQKRTADSGEGRSGRPAFRLGPEDTALPDDPRDLEDRAFPDGLKNLADTAFPMDPREVPPLKYHQVFEDRIGFIPNLSILDLLFCEGKRVAELLNA
jgi:hypothetical protein